MSDDEQPQAPKGFASFLFGQPPTPEEILNSAKAHRARIESITTLLKEAQLSLREAATYGYLERVQRARKHVAIGIEELESELLK